jgi:hypothetical protein
MNLLTSDGKKETRRHPDARPYTLRMQLVLSGRVFCALNLLLIISLTACSSKVPAERVAGTYLASYPFGKATLVLERNGTFVQSVAINGQNPEIARGSWNFDPTQSEVTLHNAMVVVNGFGELKDDWRHLDDLTNQPVEMLWFRTELEISESYPYIKQ